MAQYDLNDLLEWARRAGGDRIIPTADTFESDGSVTLTLGLDGSVAITSVSIDGTLLTGSDFTADGDTITFATAPTDEALILVQYQTSVYTDDEILDFLGDAAIEVASDLHVDWVVSTPIIDDVNGVLFNDGGRPDKTILKLIVLKTALAIRTDLANTAADDAIMVRDGDTTIDTSKAASSSERSLKRLQGNYDNALMRALNSRFKGAGYT